MRYTKGKWVASYRDTFSLDYTLSPIILAALKRFREQSHKDMFGFPCILHEDFNYGEDYEAYPEIWEMLIDKMIFAFDNTTEPNRDNYNFEINMKSLPKNEKGMIPVELTTENEEEKERYYSDMKIWEDKCQEGYLLFGKYFKNLWW